MKPKIVAILAALLLPLATLAQSGSLSIDGREWADANVAAPGTFASRPDVYTEFYTWSSLTALPATGASVAGFSYIKSTPAAWTVNPCPAEYRLPTAEEFAKLNASGSSNAAAGERGNAVAGRFYGPNHATASLPNNMAGAIFLPMGGGRSGVSGKLIDQDLAGYYWSSTAATGNNGTALVFNDTWKAWSALQTRYSRSVGMNLRCVRTFPPTGCVVVAGGFSNASGWAFTEVGEGCVTVKGNFTNTGGWNFVEIPTGCLAATGSFSNSSGWAFAEVP
jgi:uncharacterized protein (TIGR02145 family)